MKRSRHIMGILVMIAVLALPRLAAAADWPTTWVVSAEDTTKHLAAPVTILDTRSWFSYWTGHLPGAVRVEWKDFAQSGTNGGKLLSSDQRLQKKLRALGVFDDRPVLVVGDPVDGWGEDGRIVWMLRTLGHERAALVDGGMDALEAAGVETVMRSSDPTTGDFNVSRTSRWSASRGDVRRAIRSSKTVIVDTREAREYAGQTPYGESRGGHVPGAVHIYYRDLMNEDGHLRSPKRLRARLRKDGITPDTPVIAYCTGGVRSGWFVAVLVAMGYPNARNFAGSMWEWAAAPADTHTLEKK